MERFTRRTETKKVARPSGDQESHEGRMVWGLESESVPTSEEREAIWTEEKRNKKLRAERKSGSGAGQLQTTRPRKTTGSTTIELLVRRKREIWEKARCSWAGARKSRPGDTKTADRTVRTGGQRKREA